MSRSEEFHTGRGYGVGHMPDIDGPGIHEVDKTYPDFYEHPQWYHYGDHSYTESTRVIMGARGNPEKPVRIYRAVPKDVGDEINPGDWVTPSRSYAKQHGEGNLGDVPYKILSKTVPAKHVREGSGNSICEWGYCPS